MARSHPSHTTHSAAAPGLCLAVALAVCWAVPAPAAETKSKNLPKLERALLERAPTIIKNLKKDRDPDQTAYVGVLKFLVAKGKKTASDNVGAFNLTMA